MFKDLKLITEAKIKDLNKNLLSEQNDLQKYREEFNDLETIISFFEKVIDMNTKSTREFIENLVNDAIYEITGNKSISITINSSIKNNKVQYSLRIHDKENNLEGSKESFGGGVLAIISFILRVIIMHLDKTFPLIVIDENLTYVSHHYQENMSQFIKKISEEFHINVLMISHQEKLNTYADKIYEIEKINGISILKEEV